VTTDPSSNHLPALDRLASDIDGRVIAPSDPDYDAGRRVYNQAIDRRPAAIVRCVSTQDVAKAVRFARAQGLPLAVRSGANHPAGFATGDDCLLIDVSGMKAVQLDLERRVATAQPGVTVTDMDRETFRHGLICSTGTCDDVTVAGVALSGGFSYLSTLYGLTCDQLVGLEVVTADGEVFQVDEERHPDLFWAMRGSGPNFGVATALQFKMYPCPRKVYGGHVTFIIDDVAGFLDRLTRFTDNAPDALGLEYGFDVIPPEPGSGKTEPRFSATVEVCYAGPADEGEALVDQLRALGTVHSDNARLLEFPWMNLCKTSPWDSGHYWTGEYVPVVSEQVLAILERELVKAYERSNGGAEWFGGLFNYPMRGAITRVPEDATSYGRRDPGWMIDIIAAWPRDTDGGAAIDWAIGLRDALGPVGKGTGYLNACMDEGLERVERFYGPEKFAKLRALKRRYDPDNVFRFNQNIPPG
jgi:FAD/FMN-containing dehydrogenase